MTQSEPIFIIKKNTKRPSGVVSTPAFHDLSWIDHLHRLWAIPRDDRGVTPRLSPRLCA